MKIVFKQLIVERFTVRALDEITFTVDSSQTPSIAILGSNGAGKSTLMGAVLGLCPITSGQIFVDDQEVTRHSLSSIRKRIGMIFQNSDDQLFSQTVEEDVAFGPNNLRLPADEVERRVSLALERLGISQLASREITRLSGGEKRRAALAGVLAMNPEAIFLDEPTSMLDPRGCRCLAEYLNTLPVLKLMATHDLNFAQKVCRHALVLNCGKILASGPLEVLLKDEALLAEAGLR